MKLKFVILIYTKIKLILFKRNIYISMSQLFRFVLLKEVSQQAKVFQRLRRKIFLQKYFIYVTFITVAKIWRLLCLRIYNFRLYAYVTLVYFKRRCIENFRELRKMKEKLSEISGDGRLCYFPIWTQFSKNYIFLSSELDIVECTSNNVSIKFLYYVKILRISCLFEFALDSNWKKLNYI